MCWKLGLLGFPELSMIWKQKYPGSILLPPLPAWQTLWSHRTAADHPHPFSHLWLQEHCSERGQSSERGQRPLTLSLHTLSCTRLFIAAHPCCRHFLFCQMWMRQCSNFMQIHVQIKKLIKFWNFHLKRLVLKNPPSNPPRIVTWNKPSLCCFPPGFSASPGKFSCNAFGTMWSSKLGFEQGSAGELKLIYQMIEEMCQ